ncbi:MAG: hypothetical protein LIO91_01365 [Bacteroidales bacterium]|nr:hypothetical protein [Bacteroidales bacterium]
MEETAITTFSSLGEVLDACSGQPHGAVADFALKYIGALNAMVSLGKIATVITLTLVTALLCFAMLGLGRYHNNAERPTPLIAFAVLIAALFMLVLPFQAPEVVTNYEASRLEMMAIGVSMAWWIGVAIFSAWCIQRSGLDRDYQPNNRRMLYRFGRLVNNILYIGVVALVFLLWIMALCCNVSMPKLAGSAWLVALVSLVSCVVLMAVAFVVYLKGFGRVFYTANPGLFKVLSAEYFVGIFILAWRFNYANVNGWWWIATTVVILYVAIVASLSALKLMKYRRCARCHCMDASLSNAWRGELRKYTGTDWYKPNVGGPKHHYQDERGHWQEVKGVVSDYRKEYNVTGWTQEHIDTYTCPRCGHSWEDIYTSGSQQKGSATGRERWTETHIIR